MRWPFRRPPSAADGLIAPEPEPESQPPTNQAAHEGASAPMAWRELPTITPALPAMPTLTDQSFSQSLPTRWNTPPALGALGHDVRTDVPGGLISGVARTVDPRDTRPADLVWRTPDISGLRTPAAAIPQATQMTETIATVASPDSATSTVAPLASASPTAVTTNPGAPLARTRYRMPFRNRTSAPHDLPASVPQTPEALALPNAPFAAQTSVSPSADASPDAASPDTAPTRQALHDAASAVEARNPRPVSADVTDGSTAAAPVSGVNAGPEPETLESPPSASTTDPGRLLTPREARPGPDPLGSTPAVAPLISRTTLPRTSPQPITQAAPPAPPADPTPIAAQPQSPSPTATPPPTTMSALATTTPALDYDGEPAPSSSPTTPAPRTPEPPPPTSPTPATPATAPTAPTSATAPISPTSATSPSSTTSATSSNSVAFAASPPSPKLDPTPLPLSPSRIAPLVSAAARSIPTAAPISILQAPTTPVDQPARAAESMVNAESLIASSARPFAHSLTHDVTRQSSMPIPQTAAREVTAALATPIPAAALADPAATTAPAEAGTTRTSATTATVTTPSPSPPPSPFVATTHDPAALDSLARQLYGRFSRHLAGELLVDRERAQFLTDLA